MVTQKRVILPLETEEFGTVLYIPIGAHTVGSINFTLEKNESFIKGNVILGITFKKSQFSKWILFRNGIFSFFHKSTKLMLVFVTISLTDF